MLSSVLSLLGTSMSSPPFFSLLLPQKPTAPISNSSLRGRMHAFSREPQRKVRGFHLVVGWWWGYADHARGVLHSVVLFSALPWDGLSFYVLGGPIFRGGGVCVAVGSCSPTPALHSQQLCNFWQVTAPLCGWYFNTPKVCIYHMLSMALDISFTRAPSLLHPADRAFILTFQMRKQKPTNG